MQFNPPKFEKTRSNFFSKSDHRNTRSSYAAELFCSNMLDFFLLPFNISSEHIVATILSFFTNKRILTSPALAPGFEPLFRALFFKVCNLLSFAVTIGVGNDALCDEIDQKVAHYHCFILSRTAHQRLTAGLTDFNFFNLNSRENVVGI